MKIKRPKLTPLLIALAVLALVCGLRALHLDFFERLERMTYDLRVRAAQHFPAPTATNLAFVSIEEASIKAVHDGEIGKLVSVDANYQCGMTWESMDQLLRKDPKNPEVRLRAWGVDRILSGDVITEQNIHALDVACWMLDAEPIRAYGTGGRKRNYEGNCWDHFAVIYYFPNDLVVSFNSHQAGFGYDDIMCRAYGLKGAADTHYFGNVMVKATDFHLDGQVVNLYSEGVEANIATFHNSITNGECANPTVPASVRSNLTTILGRMAAYKNGVVTWQEMMHRKEKFTADLKGLKA